MPIIIRQKTPGLLSRYQEFKRFLRLEFCHSCVYCTVHESEHAGYRHFHVEHHRPKRKYPELALDYSNMLYSCDICGPYKGDDWPSGNPLVDGRGYLDPCEHDYREHFVLEADGKIEGLSEVARYMIERLHLNREHMIRMRSSRLRFFREFPCRCTMYDSAMEILESRFDSLSDSPNDKEYLLDLLNDLRRAKEGLIEKHDGYWQPPYEEADLR